MLSYSCYNSCENHQWCYIPVSIFQDWKRLTPSRNVHLISVYYKKHDFFKNRNTWHKYEHKYETLNSVMQINITITVFRLLGFAKLSRKNRAAKDSRRSGAIAKPTINMGRQQLPRKNSAAKNFRRSGAIAKSQIQWRSALFIAQNCAAENSLRCGAIAKPTLNIGQQQLPRKNRAAKNLRRSGAIANPKMKQGSATITTLTKVRNPRKIRAAAQYVYNPPPYST